MEDKFEEMFNEHPKELKSVEKQINKEITKRVVTILTSILVVGAILVSALSYGTDLYYKNKYYNPFKEEGAAEMYPYLVDEETAQEITFDELPDENSAAYGNGKNYYYSQYNYYLMSNFVSTFFPGYIYLAGGSEIEDLGNGNYKINGAFGRRKLDVNVEILQNEYYIEQSESSLNYSSGIETYFLERSGRSAYDEQKDIYLTQTLIPEVESMPDSSLFEVYVTYENPIPLEEWNKDNLPVYDYRYALTKFGEGQLRSVGFTLKDGSSSLYMQNAQHKYTLSYANDIDFSGCFVDFEKNTSDDYYEYYKMRLSILKEHPKFVSTVEIGINEVSGIVESELEKVENRAVLVEGYLAHVDKEEFLEILKDENTYYVQVKDVKYSIFK